MSGGSKKQTTGYWYSLGMHLGICRGPVDSVMELRSGDRTFWKGDQAASGQISINAENLFGGKSKEGGIVGTLDVMMGEATQGANSYLASKQSGPQPGYRGFLSLVFRGGKIAANNPYIKPWAVRVKRILQGWDGGSAWYPEKAPVLVKSGSSSVSGGPAWLVTDGIGYTSFTAGFDGGTWVEQTHDLPGGIRGIGFKAGDYLYAQDPPSYANISDLSDWTAVSGWTTATLRGYATDGSYIYIARGFNVLGRMPYPTGAMTTPNITADSYAETLCVWQGDLYIFSTIDNRCFVSFDQGANFTARTEFRTLGVGAVAPMAVANSDGIAVAFVDNAGSGPVKITFSNDGGVSWSTPANPMTTDNVLVGMVWTGAHFVVATGAGYTAYSANGLTWTAGATVPGGLLTIAFGNGKIICTKADGTMVQSINDAQSWTAFTGPTASDNGEAYFIGEETAVVTEADVYAMNPAHIIYECLTNRDWGLGYPAGKLDLASFAVAANTFYAEGMGLCLEWNRQDSIQNFIQMVIDHAGAAVGEDPRTGQFKLRALRGDYTLATLPEYSAEAGNIISLDDFDRASLTETVNEIGVTYTDATTGKNGSVTVQQLANIQAQGGVVNQGRNYPGLPTLELAVRVALRDLKAAASALARVRLTATRAAWAVTPGDVIKFVWPEFGITAMALRVAKVDYGSLTDGAIRLECVEDVFGLPSNAYVKPPTIGWEEPNTTPAASPAVESFEVPFRDLVQTMGLDDASALPVDAGYLAGVAVRPTGVPLNYELRTKVGATAYAVADTGDWCPSATLLAAVAPLDTTLTLANVVDLDEIDVGDAILLGAEICRVDAVDTTLNTLTVGRGCCDTVAAPWPIGTRVWAYDRFVSSDSTQYSDGETVNAKFVTQTSSGVLAEGSSPTDSLLMNGRAARPYPPGLLRFNDDLNTGLAYPVELAGAVVTTWAARDRLLQQDQLIDENDAGIGPEAGTTYTAYYYQPPGTLVNSESGLPGPAASPYTFPADGQAQIVLEAVRSGLTSWQAHSHTFDYYRFPRVTTVAGEGRITDDGSARKVI